MKKIMLLGIFCFAINAIQLMAMQKDLQHTDSSSPISVAESAESHAAADQKSEKLQVIQQAYTEAYENLTVHMVIKSRILKLIRYFEIQPATRIFPDSVFRIFVDLCEIFERNQEFLYDNERIIGEIRFGNIALLSESKLEETYRLCMQYKNKILSSKESIIKDYRESIANFLSNPSLLHKLLLAKRDSDLKKAPNEFSATIVHNTYKRAIGFLKILGESIGIKIDFEPKTSTSSSLSPSAST